MEWTCPACGFENSEDAKICTCGFLASNLDNTEPADLKGVKFPSDEPELTEDQIIIVGERDTTTIKKPDKPEKKSVTPDKKGATPKIKSTTTKTLTPETQKAIPAKKVAKPEEKPAVEKGAPKAAEMKAPGKPPKKLERNRYDEIVIKESGDWSIYYSKSDNVICIRDDADEPGILKISPTLLKDMFAFAEEKKLIEISKPKRELKLIDAEILELVRLIEEIIESKKSQVHLTYSSLELKEIAIFFNKILEQNDKGQG